MIFYINIIDTIRRKRTLLCRFAHTDTLCVRGCVVIQAYCVKQYFLLFFGKIGKLNGGGRVQSRLRQSFGAVRE